MAQNVQMLRCKMQIGGDPVGQILAQRYQASRTLDRCFRETPILSQGVTENPCSRIAF